MTHFCFVVFSIIDLGSIIGPIVSIGAALILIIIIVVTAVLLRYKNVLCCCKKKDKQSK